jgi:uncharacterized lipoprotein YddW (UPF0748 family)
LKAFSHLGFYTFKHESRACWRTKFEWLPEVDKFNISIRETVRLKVLKILISVGLAGVLFGGLIPRILEPQRFQAAKLRATGITQTAPDITINPSSSVSFGAAGVKAQGLENVKPVTPEASLKRAPNLEKPSTAIKLTQVTPVNQLRGLWVDAFGPGFKTPKEVDKLISDARALRLNALFVQVGRRMDCYCDRASVPRSADPKLMPGFDPLEDIIQKAHKVGIQVHAWMITTAAFNSTEPALAKDHVMNLHGLKTTGREYWLTTRANGDAAAGKDYVLDPGHPDVADYISNMYSSIVENYDVDGIQFDRVRYPDNGVPPYEAIWGYNPTALEAFKSFSGRTDTPKNTDADWTQWRRDQINNLVKRVYLSVKAIRPSIWVSAATITYKEAPATLEDFTKTRTYSEVLQDWVAWMQTGILDLNIPMNYKRESVKGQATWFDGWNRFAVQTKAYGSVAVGTGIFINSLDESLNQLKRAFQVPGVSGWVGYSYRTPDQATFDGRRNGATAFEELRAKLTTKSAAFAGNSAWGTAPLENLAGLIGRVSKNGMGVANQTIMLEDASGKQTQLFTDSGGYYGLPNVQNLGLEPGMLKLQINGVQEQLEIQRQRIVVAPELEMPM